MLHCERVLKEDLALSYCSGFVVDVGGNPLRHYKMNRTNVWSAVPVKTGSDVARFSRFEQSDAFMYCDHALPNNITDCGCSHADTWLSVDSLYYLTTYEISVLVSKAPMVAVVHDFKNANGILYDGEAKYQVRSDGQVEMVVRGSSVSYVHSALGWMRKGSVCTDHEQTFTWYMLKSIGTSVIYKFEKCEGFV